MRNVLRWDREPRAQWVRALRRIAPPTEHMSHLILKWVPIARRRWAERWVVFEAIPLPYCQPYINQLVGEDLNDPLLKWGWDYLLKHNAFPVPFWVCQGAPQGHPFAYNVIEKAQASIGQLPEAPPRIGELAYSEPCDLTWEAIRRRSTLNRKLQDAMQERQRVKQEAERAARRQMLAQIENDLGDVVQEAQRDVLDVARVVDKDDRSTLAHVSDEAFDEYIETGRLPYLAS